MKERDLILSTRGTVGLCALVTKEVLPANIDQDIARIVVNDSSKIEPEYLLSYLNSEYGQDWLLRNVSGMVQQGLPLNKVREIPVPLLSIKFQKYCKQIIDESYNALHNSKVLYLEAQNTILSELNLINWHPKYRLSFVKKYSDTQSASRIDAEYFQPIYDEVTENILSYKNGYYSLSFRISL